MTIDEAIFLVDELKPNQIEKARKIEWLSRLDERLFREVICTHALEEEPEKWDGIVRTFKSFDTYYLSGYGKAFYLHGDGDPLLFYYNDGKISGINVVMKRDISEDPHFKDVLNDRFYDLATPYGYGGWLIEARDPCSGKENLEWLFREYGNWNSRFWQWCAAQSYGAYIFHMLLMLVLQFATDNIWMGAFGKFMFIGIVSTIVSFVLTWLVRMIPGVKKVL